MNRPGITALLLPGYSPGLNWFALALGSSRIILDDLHPFSRKSRIHRAKIRTPDGSQWISIPFVNSDRRKPVNEVRIDDRRPWLGHHLQALEFNYRNSLYFDYYEPEIRSDLHTASESGLLIDAVRHLMQRQWVYLQLSEFPEWASEHYQFHTDLYQSSGFETVWQEPDSRNYQKPHPSAVQPAVKHPEYRQHFQGFIRDCSIMDLLFEYGPDAWQILDQLNNNRSEVRNT